MTAIDLDILLAACRPGGASVLTATTELEPAAGPHAGIAPARYKRGNTPTYAFERRYVDLDGTMQAAHAVLINSKPASLNDIEGGLSQAITDGIAPLRDTPRIRVTYDGLEPVTCLDVPHRAFDGHIRAGTVDSVPVPEVPAYRAARDSTAADARALLELSPVGLILGVWDSTRKSHQVRFRSALVGETIGILADQSETARQVDQRGAARKDDIAPSVRLSADDMQKLLASQKDELSETNIKKISESIKKAKGGTTSAAALGLGALPPSLDALGLVSCSRIIRSHVLSFSALRQLRFGLGVDGDAAARALLAALALNGLIRSYAELTYRANCDLVEKAEPVVVLDARYGRKDPLDVPSIEDMDVLLEAAISGARSHGVRWEGQVLDVVGSPLIAGAIEADEDVD